MACRGLPATSFATLIRQLRLQHSLTQEELSDQAGLSVRQIRNLESGRVITPRRTTVLQLAAALKLETRSIDRLDAARRAGGRCADTPGGHEATAGTTTGHPVALLLVTTHLPDETRVLESLTQAAVAAGAIAQTVCFDDPRSA